MAGWFLVIAILILGGVIATVGDRIGTRVGKARLSLFNLRPRKTAVLISILTGSLISGTTLALLFGVSSQLRKGVFEYDATRKKLRDASKELKNVKEQRTALELQRDTARTQQRQARQSLNIIESQLKTAQTKQSSTQAELDRVASRADQLRREAEQLLTQQRQLITQRDQVLAQINQRNREIGSKNAVIRSRETEIITQERDLSRQSADLAQRNRLLRDRDRQLAEQRKVVQDGEVKLASLIEQKEILDRSIAEQEQQLQRVRQGLAYYRDNLDNVRQGSIVLSRSEVISTRVVRVTQSDLVRVAIDQVLREANEQAMTILQLRDRTQPVIQANPLDVARLGQDLSDGREYVVRVISAKNYLLNETGVQVILDATPNVRLFPKGASIATTAIQPNSSREQAQQGVTLLVESARYRVGRAGVLGDNFTIGDGRFKSFANFLEKVQQSDQPLTLQAIARESIQTAGPTRIDLLALLDGKVIFGTNE